MKKLTKNNCFKLRHIHTGLYFKPGTYPYKNNLSKNGKTYFYESLTSNIIDNILRCVLKKHPLNEWEIVIFELTEIETKNILDICEK